MTARAPVALLALLAAATLSACGSTPQPAQTAQDAVTSTGSIRNLEPEDRWTEGDIIRALHLRDEDPEYPGLSHVTPSGIGISVILTNAGAVNLYAGAGDQVATNPAGDAGVKFGANADYKGTNAEAAAELTRGLATLK